MRFKLITGTIGKSDMYWYERECGYKVTDYCEDVYDALMQLADYLVSKRIFPNEVEVIVYGEPNIT